MYIIAGSTGTLGSAIAEELAQNHDIFLIGRDESKLKEQADKYLSLIHISEPTRH